MTRDITPIKWLIGAIALLIIIAGACYLWYRYDTAPYEREAAEATELARQWELTQKADSENKLDQAADAPVEGSTLTTEKPINWSTAEVENNTENGDITEAQTPAEIPTATEERVSPFGFGPYPEVPPDFPHQDIFDPRPYHSKTDPDYELMRRVWVELWKRGEKVEGMGTLGSTGLFYPTIRGTIYVEWGPRWKIFGHEVGRRIRYVKGHPDDMKRLRANRGSDVSPLLESDIPSDLKVLDISEGIDAYQFLNFPK